MINSLRKVYLDRFPECLFNKLNIPLEWAHMSYRPRKMNYTNLNVGKWNILWPKITSSGWILSWKRNFRSLYLSGFWTSGGRKVPFKDYYIVEFYKKPEIMLILKMAWDLILCAYGSKVITFVTAKRRAFSVSAKWHPLVSTDQFEMDQFWSALCCSITKHLHVHVRSSGSKYW